MSSLYQLFCYLHGYIERRRIKIEISLKKYIVKIKLDFIYITDINKKVIKLSTL